MSKQKSNGMMKPDKWKRRYWTAAGAAVLCLCCTTPAMAAGGDPLDIVNNLSDFTTSQPLPNLRRTEKRRICAADED